MSIEDGWGYVWAKRVSMLGSVVIMSLVLLMQIYVIYDIFLREETEDMRSNTVRGSKDRRIRWGKRNNTDRESIASGEDNNNHKKNSNAKKNNETTHTTNSTNYRKQGSLHKQPSRRRRTVQEKRTRKFSWFMHLATLLAIILLLINGTLNMISWVLFFCFCFFFLLPFF